MCQLREFKGLTIILLEWLLGLIDLRWCNLMVLITSMPGSVELRLENCLLRAHLKVGPIGLGGLPWWFTRLSYSLGWTCDRDHVVDARWFIVRVVVWVSNVIIQRVWLTNFTAHTGLVITLDSRILVVWGWLGIQQETGPVLFSTLRFELIQSTRSRVIRRQHWVLCWIPKILIATSARQYWLWLHLLHQLCLLAL